MKKYSFGFLALLTAIISVSFTTDIIKTERTSYYFEFKGMKNSEESNEAKWDEITASAYTFLNCNGSKYGCKIITTAVQTINGSTRPATIYLVPGTNNPTTGATVTEAKNFTNSFF